MNYVWLGKKVYLNTFSGRKYEGKVIDETRTHLILIDNKNRQIELSKVDIQFCQEEKW